MTKKRAGERDIPEREAIEEAVAIEDTAARIVEEAEELEELQEMEAKLPPLLESTRARVQRQLHALGLVSLKNSGLEIALRRAEADRAEKIEAIERAEALTRKVFEADAEFPVLRERLARIREAIAVENAAIGKASVELADANLERNRLLKENAAANKSIDEANATLKSLQGTLTDLQQKIQTAQQNVEQWREKLRVATREELTLQMKLLIAEQGEEWREHLLAALGAARYPLPKQPAAPAQMYEFSGQVDTEQGPASLAGYRVLDMATQNTLLRGAASQSGEITFMLDQPTALLVMDRQPDQETPVTGNPIASAASARA